MHFEQHHACLASCCWCCCYPQTFSHFIFFLHFVCQINIRLYLHRKHVEKTTVSLAGGFRVSDFGCILFIYNRIFNTKYLLFCNNRSAWRRRENGEAQKHRRNALLYSKCTYFSFFLHIFVSIWFLVLVCQLFLSFAYFFSFLVAKRTQADV